MKKTSSLRVHTDFSLTKNKIVIHPNDAFDLGLTDQNKVCAIYLNVQDKNIIDNKAYVHGYLALDNNCHSGTVNINAKIWRNIGKPHKVVLASKGNSIFFIPHPL